MGVIVGIGVGERIMGGVDVVVGVVDVVVGVGVDRIS